MSENIDFEDNIFNEGKEDMGSYNHSLLQSKLNYLLGNDERFTAFTELSLDT